MASLYFVDTHWMFDHPELDLDRDLSFFVIADSPRDAVELWLNQINEANELTLAYQCRISSAEIAAYAKGDTSKNMDQAVKRCIEVRDLSFDLNFAAPMLIGWDKLEPQCFVLQPF